MINVKILQNISLHRAVTFFCHIFVGTLMMIFTFRPILFAQAQDNWPKPCVAIFDCNSLAASTDNTNEQDAINSASKFILQDIFNDSSSQEVFLILYGNADTAATAVAGSFSLPDTGRTTDGDYVIGSKITGSSGSYTLTVSIEDGHTYQHVADGTAAFGSATSSNVKTACLSAVQQILPLTTKIRNYWELLKSVNPLLTINPQVDISPAKLKLPLKGSTNVTITAIDCDGTPIANRQLTLESSLGSFSTSSVQTDENGKTSVVFNAGASQGTATLNATIQNMISISYDTTDVSASALIITGNVDTTDLWVMEFNASKTYSSGNDVFTQNDDGTGWQRKNESTTIYARGKCFGDIIQSDSIITFSGQGADAVLIGPAKYSDYNFSLYSHAGIDCLQKIWDMTGVSENAVGKVDSTTGMLISFSYNPQGYDFFVISIPYLISDYYMYGWSVEGKLDEHGHCWSSSQHTGTHIKKMIPPTLSIVYQGNHPVSGLSIIPSYTGSSISSYTIIVNNTITGYKSDGSLYVTIDQCTATLKPFSSGPTGVKTIEPPIEFTLTQNYPNPFNPSTTIGYHLSSNSFVTLKVHDVLGKEVAALVNQRQAAGVYNVMFDAAKLSSGVYFYILQAGSFTSVKKMLLLK